MTTTDTHTLDAVAATSVAGLWQKVDRGDLLRTLVVAACTFAVALGLTWPWPQLPLVAVGAWWSGAGRSWLRRGTTLGSDV